jgi:hypothetical protein
MIGQACALLLMTAWPPADGGVWTRDAIAQLEGWWIVTSSNYKVLEAGDLPGSGWRFRVDPDQKPAKSHVQFASERGELVRVGRPPGAPQAGLRLRRLRVVFHQIGAQTVSLDDSYRARIRGDRLRIRATFWMDFRRATPSESAQLEAQAAAGPIEDAPGLSGTVLGWWVRVAASPRKEDFFPGVAVRIDDEGFFPWLQPDGVWRCTFAAVGSKGPGRWEIEVGEHEYFIPAALAGARLTLGKSAAYERPTAERLGALERTLSAVAPGAAGRLTGEMCHALPLGSGRLGPPP